MQGKYQIANSWWKTTNLLLSWRSAPGCDEGAPGGHEAATGADEGGGGQVHHQVEGGGGQGGRANWAQNN